MVPDRRSVSHLARSLALAVGLTLVTVAGAAALDATVGGPATSEAAQAVVPPASGAVLHADSATRTSAERAAPVPWSAPVDTNAAAAPGPTGRPATPAASATANATAPTGKAKPVVQPKPTARPKAVAKPKPVSAEVHRGRNHVWMPALGIDRSVSGYACSNSAYPGNLVYRWGCAGSNNVYLFGHAASVFRSLHDAYVAGRLRRGMALWYADGAGTVHRYTIAWWKVTTPTKGTWAYAAQSTPSLTLQTCLGAQSQYRLIVRLVRND